MKSLRIAVAGHVDHGKSTIIGRLLHETGSLAQHVTDKFDETQRSHGAHAATFAFVTDQLSEEQEGSFTLDTTQARLRTPNGDFTLIDTPGHREFLKNMISGTTRADAAILVVDAAEGPLPQTYLHAYLISMLGIRQMILVINKMDLVHYSRSRFMALSQQLSEHLGRLCIPPIAVVPVSAQQGDNVVRQSAHMIWNTSPTLIEAIEHLPPPERNGSQPLRFLVQCCFPVGGHTAVLGRVSSGNLRQGQPIVFGPLGHKTTVTAVRRESKTSAMPRRDSVWGSFLRSRTRLREDTWALMKKMPRRLQTDSRQELSGSARPLWTVPATCRSSVVLSVVMPASRE